MGTIKDWIQAARPRTLILGLAAPTFCYFLAHQSQGFEALSFTCFTHCFILLQLVSNLANDMGDGLKGSDNHKLGEQRSFGKKGLGKKEFTKAIFFVSLLALVLGILALIFSQAPGLGKVIIFFLGIVSIAAALGYTLGKRSYGYVGLGDLSVFLFFGFVPVYVPLYLSTGAWPPNTILMALALGFVSTAVLNVNNLRDYPEDKKNGKKTMVVRMGFALAKVYHLALLVGAAVLCLLFHIKSADNTNPFIVIPVIILLALGLLVWRQKNLEKLDHLIKFHALACLIMALVTGVLSI